MANEENSMRLWQQYNIRTYEDQNRKIMEWITPHESGTHVDDQ